MIPAFKELAVQWEENPYKQQVVKATEAQNSTVGVQKQEKQEIAWECCI